MSEQSTMRIHDPLAYRQCSEPELIGELLDVRGRQVLDAGCGAAWMSRWLIEQGGAARVVGLEVDTRQLARNRAQNMPEQLVFREEGAQAISDPDATYDVACMFKSLHHVPRSDMAQALREIHRVLRPGGRLYVCEPVYWGEFNALMCLIHDEREVRQAAFAALQQVVAEGLFTLEREVFFQSEGTYADWESFRARFIEVTHTGHDLDAARLAQIEVAFRRHCGPDGARFLKPHRVDLLVRAPA